MITFKANDTRPLDVVLKRGNEVIDLTGANVSFLMRAQNSTGAVTSGACDVEVGDPEAGECRYEWQPGQTDKPGLYYGEWEVTYPGGEVETVPANGFETIRIVEDLEMLEEG